MTTTEDFIKAALGPEWTDVYNRVVEEHDDADPQGARCEAFIRAVESATDFERREGAGYVSLRCPAHDDYQPSLSVQAGDRGVIANCHAGCEFTEVVEAIGWHMEDCFYDNKDDSRTSEPTNLVTSTTEYKYRDLEGRLVAVNTRYDYIDGTKTFNWQPKVGNPLKIYGAERVGSAKAENRLIWVVEGEKCVDALIENGEVAVSLHGGAKAARNASHLVDLLDGARVVICADGDQAGTEWEEQLVKAFGSQEPIRVDTKAMKWVDGYDISDWLDDFAGMDPRSTLIADGPLTRRANERANIKPVEWVWDERIALNAINLFAGNPEEGKSTSTAWMVSALSRGELPGKFYGTPQRSLVLAREETADVVLAKLVAHGANLNFVTVMDESERVAPFSDSTWWRKAMRAAGHPVFVVGDPLSPLLNGKQDHSEQQMREVLDQLKQGLFAPHVSPNGVAFLGIRHLKKSDVRDGAMNDPLDLINGTKAGLVGVARCVLFAFREEVDGSSHTVISLEKNNLVRKEDVPAVTGQLEGATISGGVKTVKFLPQPQHTVEGGFREHMKRLYKQALERTSSRSKFDEALEAVSDKAPKGWIRTKDLNEVLAKHGISLKGSARVKFTKLMCENGWESVRTKETPSFNVWFQTDGLSAEAALAEEKKDRESHQ